MSIEPARPEAVRCIESVIRERRSIRKFSPEIPSREIMESILDAGMLAPYAALAKGSLADCRKFFVLTRDTSAMAEAEQIVNHRVKKNAGRFALAVRIIPSLRRKGQAFSQRLTYFANHGFADFKNAAYIVVVAERRGFPPVQKQSIAHALQNMWLQATALGVGFHLLSFMGTLSDHKPFTNFLGLEHGEFDLDGFACGFPAQNPEMRDIVKGTDVTKWL